jgi:ferredoxin hydrogenase
MTCPQGCISGGGQPKLLCDTDVPEAYDNRRKAIYEYDKELPNRLSHENPDVKKLYKEFLGEPCGEKSHHLLHTTYKTA